MQALVVGFTLLLSAVVLSPSAAALPDPPTGGTAPAVSTTPEREQTSRYEPMSLEDLLGIRVVTASQQDESLREAPVPVTVITADMIRAIGARTLQDVLVTYVPGMTISTDHNEMNVAMRGIYTSSQQKILVMLDGHRLNSRAYSMANPDYSLRIDLDRVKQIEVLRGPGSSLYGNVALTAVINVVTRSGSEIDGTVVTLGGGVFASGLDDGHNRGSLPAGESLGFTYGKAFAERRDLVLWGGYFRAAGQRIPVSRADDYSASPRDGYTVVGGVQDPGSYDAGLRYRAGGFALLANVRDGKYVEPFAGGGATTGEVYDYEAFRKLRGLGPGLDSRSQHVELEFAPARSGSLGLEFTGYYDTNDLSGVVVTNPARNAASLVHWIDDAVGGSVQASWEYGLGGATGTLLAGAQVDRMHLRSSDLSVAEGGEWVRFGDSSSAPLLQPGSETVYSAFLQAKHRVTGAWIVNAGFRLDEKDRHLGANIHNFSPRLGVVWVPNDRLDVKLSYAQSFVDAPYWYRYNVFPSYQGSQNLRPEILESLQLTPTFNAAGGRFKNSLNVFYNEVTDFVFRDPNARGSDPRYVNAGLLKNVGVENEAAWIGESWRVRSVFTFQEALEARVFDARNGEVFNVPRLTGSLVLDVNPVPRRSKNVWLDLTLRYVGSQLAPVASTFKLGADGVVRPFSDPNNRVGAHLLTNFGVRVSRLIVPSLALDATVYNAFDTRYSQGGAVAHPYPQPGRSLMVNLSYRSGATRGGRP